MQGCQRSSPSLPTLSSARRFCIGISGRHLAGTGGGFQIGTTGRIWMEYAVNATSVVDRLLFSASACVAITLGVGIDDLGAFAVSSVRLVALAISHIVRRPHVIPAGASLIAFDAVNTTLFAACPNSPPTSGCRKYLPYAFTEHGAIMAATLLSSRRAIEVSVYVVRTFVRMRELAATHGDLAKLEDKTEALGHEPRHLQSQHPQSAQAGVRCAARTHDAARSAQAAYRVRYTGGQEAVGICTTEILSLE